jgi:hypothetical protein
MKIMKEPQGIKRIAKAKKERMAVLKITARIHKICMIKSSSKETILLILTPLICRSLKIF